MENAMKRKRLRIHAASLHYFDAVCRAGTIREAARRLNIASSAVNRQILRLEEEIGAPVFLRLSSGLRLTEAGQLLAAHIRTVLRDAEQVASRLDELRGLRAGHVEIATVAGTCACLLSDTITQMAQDYPKITVGVRIIDTHAIAEAIVNGDVHLGLAFEVPRQPEIHAMHVAQFPLGAVILPQSPMVQKKIVDISEFSEHPIILPKENFANRKQVHSLLFKAGMEDWGQYESGSIDLMKQLVLRGLGVAFMTRIGIEPELRQGLLAHVPLMQGDMPIRSELGLFVHASSPLPVAAGLFADRLMAIIDREYEATHTSAKE
ncbi:LysR family transcriptional regulator [Novacetimonas sp. GS1]